MKNYFEITIDKTAKPAGRPKAGEYPEDGYSCYDRTFERFETLTEANKWLINQGVKRIKGFTSNYY